MHGVASPPPRFALRHGLLLLAVWAIPSTSVAEPGALVAVRAEGAIRVNGTLSEPAWAHAVPFDAFVERRPRRARPKPRTVVRVVFDAERLYIGIRCDDPRPEDRSRLRGARDPISRGDSITVAIDPGRLGTAYLFTVSAGGILQDRVLVDSGGSRLMGAAWQGAAARTRSGWSAEIAVPLSALALPRGGAPPSGIYVERRVGRTGQVLASVPIPGGEGAFVSRFGALRVQGGKTLRWDAPPPPPVFAPLPEPRPLSVGAPPLVAARADGPIRVDGRLDEPAWERAPVFDALVESKPDEGAHPTSRTEIRILYDDERLYVGIRCHDPEPDLVVRQLGRRDHIPPSDSVAVALDPRQSRRVAYFFAVNAGGVLEDRLLYDDTEESDDWDAVWEGAAERTEDGWSAELAIGFALLPFHSGASQRWGIYVERKIARTHQVFSSVLIPADADAFVSRFGELLFRGGEALQPPLGLELQPFFAARAILRPQYSDPARPRPRLTDPSADVGLDFHARISSDLQVAGTVNPDFGQVEADPVILNLTRFEPFFPEKRPFFLHGMELFSSLDSGGDSPQQILYTRRIGLASPILGAAKLTGRGASGLQLGVFDAVVAGGAGSGDEANPDRRLRFQPSQPLHLAPGDTYPAQAPAPENFFAATLRSDVLGHSSVAARAVLATPLAPRCTAADALAAIPPARCTTTGGAAFAGDWDLRSASGEYALTGQVAMTSQVGGPPSRTLDDGTQLHPGDVGYGAWVTAGKTGGEPWRASATYTHAAPRLELNAAGYQPDGNEHTGRLTAQYLQTRGPWTLRSLSAGVTLSGSVSADSRALARSSGVRADTKLVLQGFHEVRCGVGYDDPHFDLREILQSGIAYRRPASWDAGCSVQTNLHAPLAVEVGARVIRVLALAPLAGAPGGRARVAAVVRPVHWLETKASMELALEPVPGRWLATEGGELLFGDLTSRSLTLTLRQQAILNPRLSVEAYAQLLAATERYGSYRSAPVPSGSVLDVTALAPAIAPSDTPDGFRRELRLNVVLRWEYAPGATLYVVYSRSQDDLTSGAARWSLTDRFGSGPAIDVLAVKWTLWYAR